MILVSIAEKKSYFNDIFVKTDRFVKTVFGVLREMLSASGYPGFKGIACGIFQRLNGGFGLLCIQAKAMVSIWL